MYQIQEIVIIVNLNLKKKLSIYLSVCQNVCALYRLFSHSVLLANFNYNGLALIYKFIPWSVNACTWINQGYKKEYLPNTTCAPILDRWRDLVWLVFLPLVVLSIVPVKTHKKHTLTLHYNNTNTLRHFITIIQTH